MQTYCNRFSTTVNRWWRYFLHFWIWICWVIVSVVGIFTVVIHKLDGDLSDMSPFLFCLCLSIKGLCFSQSRSTSGETTLSFYQDVFFSLSSPVSVTLSVSVYISLCLLTSRYHCLQFTSCSVHQSVFPDISDNMLLICKLIILPIYESSLLSCLQVVFTTVCA